MDIPKVGKPYGIKTNPEPCLGLAPLLGGSGGLSI